MNSDPFASFKIPVLTYHRIIPDIEKLGRKNINSPYSLFQTRFIEQMRFLYENAYRPISFDLLMRLMRGEIPDTANSDISKYVIICFDDGWKDNYLYAIPILKLFGLSATFFVITGNIGTREFMTWNDLDEIRQLGMRIESHTHSHLPLELLQENDARYELTHSKEILEINLRREAKFISLPHGSFPKNFNELLIHTGYSGCATSKPGYIKKTSSCWELPRILIRKNHTIIQYRNFCEKRSLALIQLALIQRIKSGIKDTIGLKKYMKLHSLVFGTYRPEVSPRREQTS